MEGWRREETRKEGEVRVIVALFKRTVKKNIVTWLIVFVKPKNTNKAKTVQKMRQHYI